MLKMNSSLEGMKRLFTLETAEMNNNNKVPKDKNLKRNSEFRDFVLDI